MPDITNHDEDTIYERVTQIVEAARAQVSRTINSAMVHAYWLIGREIVEVEQAGEERAAYGDDLIGRLAERLTARFGKGFTKTGIKRMRQFYWSFPQGSYLPAEMCEPNKGAAVRDQSPLDLKVPRRGTFPSVSRRCSRPFCRGRTTGCSSQSQIAKLAPSTKSKLHAKTGRPESSSVKCPRCSSSVWRTAGKRMRFSRWRSGGSR